MARARAWRRTPLWAEVGVGFLSGAVIPAPAVVVIDLGLLFLGLWGVLNDAAALSASRGDSPWALLGVTLAANLLNILRHLWVIRWAFLIAGGLGAVAALAESAAAGVREGWSRGLSFLGIFAALSLALDSILLIGREQQAHLMAVDRAIYFLRRLQGESYDVDLVTGSVLALALGLLFWELWRTVYRGIKVRVGLPATRDALLADRLYDPESRPRTEAVGEFDLTGAVRVVGLLALCCAVWLPLDHAYATHAPQTTSEGVYLQPAVAEQVRQVVFGASPHQIVFSSSVGHGLFDAELVRRPSAPTPVREVSDFRLRETPEGTHSYAHMSVEGLDSGEYYLRMALRPSGGLQTGASAIMGDGEGVVNYSLYQGGGASYWLIAIGMASVLTVGLLGVLALLLHGTAYLRAR